MTNDIVLLVIYTGTNRVTIMPKDGEENIRIQLKIIRIMLSDFITAWAKCVFGTPVSGLRNTVLASQI